MWKPLYNHTGSLSRFIVRSDRIRLSIWLPAISLITIITASSFTGLYQSEQERQAIAETMRNPAMTAMVGPGYGLDNYTAGAMMAHQMLLFTAITVAIMNILLVTRHTRADEEEGRIELIRSLPVGRLANVSSSMIVMCIMNILLAIIVGFGLFALQIESIDLQGSLLYGAALGATGIFFMSVTALFAQASENSRGAIGYSFTVLGVSYLIRAVGDVSNETLSWFSPLGWILGTEVYVNNYWWPIVLTMVAAFILMIVALYLNTIRDLGAGFFTAKPGKIHASRFLKNPFGLAIRLQRTAIIAWAIGMFILGASYGSVFGDLESFFASNEMLAEFLTPVEGLSLIDQFLPMLMSVIAMLCTVPALLFMIKLRSEEKKNMTEHLVARAVSRTKLIGSYFLVSIIFGTFMLLLSLVGLWFAAESVMESAISFSTIFNAGLIYLPAIWLMIGVAVFLIGYFPQLTSITWLYLGYSFFVVYLGGLLQFPEWMGKLSPFGHIPQYPIEEVGILNIFILTSIAVIFVFLGFWGYNKRDIEG
ncbi:ABC transporter permease [Alkalihalobacterium alkalinitrilicum]|uniref:ABC transporter permease n=1 Tax=Alkalihalobacterium alkalinitrilicum TaxID=427920 RepID=UPI000994AC7E|nr:ABC transporter permease [Alkalihalobacterium alkalinitrilicum]